jgi:hypothetical protein
VQTLSKYYNSTYSTQPKFFSERQMGRGRKTKLVSIANAITLVRQFSATTSDGTRERFVSVLEELLRGNLGLIFDCPNYKAGEGDRASDDDDHDDDDDNSSSSDEDEAVGTALARSVVTGVSPRVPFPKPTRLSDMAPAAVDDSSAAASSATGGAAAGACPKGSGDKAAEVPLASICTESNAAFMIDFSDVRRGPRMETRLPVYNNEEHGFVVRTTQLVAMLYDTPYSCACEVPTHLLAVLSLMRISHLNLLLFSRFWAICARRNSPTTASSSFPSARTATRAASSLSSIPQIS